MCKLGNFDPMGARGKLWDEGWKWSVIPGPLGTGIQSADHWGRMRLQSILRTIL